MKNRTISNREVEVLRLISQGNTIKEIAKALFISPQTVASHRRNMMAKLKARNMAGLVRIGFENGILSVGSN